jgi:mannose-1-phosphate guanylyltransferase/mannose-6-phosphate isomerase
MAGITPVVLSGGSGTRLWPLSRELYPKQLLPLVGQNTMLQDTLLRLDGVPELQPPILVCNVEHRFLAAEQLAAAKHSATAIILEPVGRNTAPAVAVAALAATQNAERTEDPVLLVLPADHVIRNRAAFHAAIASGAAAAAGGSLVTFGIVPTGPETGYGYIRSTPLEAPGVRRMQEFVEKPDRAAAERYLASGEYLWNSGMFMFRASRYLEALRMHAPDILESCRRAWLDASKDLSFTRLNEASFAACRSDSIDYAVMEKTDSAVVIPLDAGWSDVGNWATLSAARDADGSENVLVGDVIVEDSHNCYVYSSGRLVATVGLRDHVVVETDDAVLVAPKNRVQDVKKLVDRLKADGRGEAALHRKVYRPWGAYDSIQNGERFQVKHITVKPGAKLSLQMHHHRAEHWIVVRGTAEVTRGDEVFLLTENQSTYIPLGTRHRLANPGTLPLELIEVQSGSYLGEDDIVRFDDTYGRAPERS